MSATCFKIFSAKSSANQNDPWWDNTCREAKTKKYALLRKFRLTNIVFYFKNYVSAEKYFRQVHMYVQ